MTVFSGNYVHSYACSFSFVLDGSQLQFVNLSSRLDNPLAAPETHQMPSQAMTMKSWSSLSVRTLTSGIAEIICSSGGRALFLL